MLRHEAGRPRYRGAFFSGSTVELSPEAELPVTSDVDVVVVVADDSAPPKLGKVEQDGVLIEVSYLSWAQLSDVEAVAHTFYLAPSFATDQIISDPTGLLRRVYDRVSARFADPAEIRARYESVIDRLETGLQGVPAGGPRPGQVLSWLFPATLATQVILVAARRSPTVRLRYPHTRDVLAARGLSAAYPPLLDLIGCAGVTRQQVQRHLDALAVTFDLAAAGARTPFPFSADLTVAARPVAIQGSQQLVDRGEHREAVFWVLATFARAQQVLIADAPTLAEERGPAFDAAVAELTGLVTEADLVRSAARVLAFLPELRRTAETLVHG